MRKIAKISQAFKDLLKVEPYLAHRLIDRTDWKQMIQCFPDLTTDEIISAILSAESYFTVDADIRNRCGRCGVPIPSRAHKCGFCGQKHKDFCEACCPEIPLEYRRR